MPVDLIDENNIRSLPDNERFAMCEQILKHDADESKRWDAVWLVGELAENSDDNNPLYNKVADLIVWVLENDNNGVVKHEAAFQIAARNMRKKIPDLMHAALNSPSVLTKHETIESLGLMRAFEVEDMIKTALTDESPDVRETAEFVLKRFARLKNAKEEYVPSQIL